MVLQIYSVCDTDQPTCLGAGSGFYADLHGQSQYTKLHGIWHGFLCHHVKNVCFVKGADFPYGYFRILFHEFKSDL